MKKILLILTLLLFAVPVYSQDLFYDSQTWANGFVSDSIDLGADTRKIISVYGSTNEETRAIGLWFDGTWTNTTFTVKACTSLTGTFDAVTDFEGTALTITMASNTWVYLNPQTFAGLRYIQLSGSAEGGARTLVVIRRRY